MLSAVDGDCGIRECPGYASGGEDRKRGSNGWSEAAGQRNRERSRQTGGAAHLQLTVLSASCGSADEGVHGGGRKLRVTTGDGEQAGFTAVSGADSRSGSTSSDGNIGVQFPGAQQSAAGDIDSGTASRERAIHGSGSR